MEDSKVLLIDNGSYKIKYGMAGDKPVPRICHNSIVKSKTSYGEIYCIGNQVENSKLLQSTTNAFIKRPKEFGMLTSWEIQSEIWDYCLYNPKEMGFDLNEYIEHRNDGTVSCPHLILTETMLHMPELSKNTDEVVFEEYAFDSLYKGPSASFIPFNKSLINKTQCYLDSNDKIVNNSGSHEDGSDTSFNKFQLVVDSGFECTYVIPIINGCVYYDAVKRSNFGGKYFTGFLKSLISYKHVDLSQETLLVNRIKEQCLYAAPDSFIKQMQKESIVKEYVLPSEEVRFENSIVDDRLDSNMGYLLKKNEKVPEGMVSLKLKEELYTVPESILSPDKVHFDSSLNMSSHGLIELIQQSLNLCPDIIKPLLVSNIVLAGGNFNIPNMKNRILRELQLNMPTEWNVRISCDEGSSELFTFYSMNEFSKTNEYLQTRITREEYFEYGLDWTTKKRFGYQAFM